LRFRENKVYFEFIQYNPLRVWLYREAFARLSGTRYTVESIEDTCKLFSLDFPNEISM